MIELVEKPVKLELRATDCKELRRIARELRVHPASYWMSPRYQEYLKTDGESGWDGYIYPLSVRGKFGTIARGHLEEVMEIAAAHGFELRAKLLPRPFAGLTEDDIPPDVLKAPFKLDLAQRRCVAAWLQHTMGMHHVATAGGKTATFLATAAMLHQRLGAACRTLYIVPTERLVNQVTASAREFLPGWGISQLGGGQRDFSGQDLVVATAASLYRNLAELSREWLRTFMCVLVDECQHLPSNSYRRPLLACPAFFRFGASDTAHDADPAKQVTMRGLIGPTREVVKLGQLIDQDRAARPLIYLVEFPGWRGTFDHLEHQPAESSPAVALIEGEWRRGTYLGKVYEDDPADPRQPLLGPDGEPIQVSGVHLVELDGERYELESRWCLLERAYDRAIIRFKARNEAIVSWASHFSGRGYPTLVVATRTTHVLILEARLRQAIAPGLVRSLFSDHTTKERDKTFSWLRATPGAVLITPLVKEGVSLPELRAGVIADPVAGWEYARQLIGRFIRRKDHDNRAHIVWFIDRQYRPYARNGLELFRHLEAERAYTFFYPCRLPGEKTAMRYAAEG